MSFVTNSISSPVSVLAFILAAFVCRSMWREVSSKIGNRQISVIGMCTVFVFLLQTIQFSTESGISCHFSGAMLVASLLGPPFACLVLAVVALVRSLLFADAPLLYLGILVLNYGIIAGLVSGRWVLQYMKKLYPHDHTGFLTALGVTSWLSLILVGSAYSLELLLSGTINASFADLIGTHLLVGIAEAALTVLIVSRLLKQRPDLVVTHCCGEDKDDCIHDHHDHSHEDLYKHS